MKLKWKGKRYNLKKLLIADLVGLLKEFLLALPEPVILPTVYNKLVTAGKGTSVKLCTDTFIRRGWKFKAECIERVSERASGRECTSAQKLSFTI